MGDHRQQHHLGYLTSAARPRAKYSDIFRVEEGLKGITYHRQSQREGVRPKRRLLPSMQIPPAVSIFYCQAAATKKALNHPKPHKDAMHEHGDVGQKYCGWTTCNPCSERRLRMRGRPYVVGRLELCALTRTGRDLAKGPSAAPKFRVEPRYRLEVKWLSAAGPSSRGG
ncbi:hypothetical protein PG989_012601 [Apiospora arundinis]